MSCDDAGTFSDVDAELHDLTSTAEAPETIRIVLHLLETRLLHNSRYASVDACNLTHVGTLALALDIISTPPSHRFSMQELLLLESKALLNVVDLVGVKSVCPRGGRRVDFKLAVDAGAAL